MYKLIALDMDGTLLKGDNTISQETKKAINLAKDYWKTYSGSYELFRRVRFNK